MYIYSYQDNAKILDQLTLNLVARTLANEMIDLIRNQIQHDQEMKAVNTPDI